MTRPPLAVMITLVATLSSGAGCGGSPAAPTAEPTRGPRAGTWAGTLTDPVNGQSALRVDLQEVLLGEVGLLGGAWTATFASGGAASGDVTGSITGAVVSLTLRRTTPISCPASAVPLLNGAFVAAALTLTGQAITGPYAYQTCDLAQPGTLDLRRP